MNQQRDIIVTQIINELGVTIETNTKPLIRCKDCRWCQDDYMGTWCSGFSGVRFTNTDDFCSHGERREP